MAKKQGISYSPNTALIQGAGVAYRNYDNAPGMYSGLDKVVTAGTEMMTGAVKEFEAEQKKKEEEAKAAELEKAKQDKDWFDLSGDVYANAGSFMKDVEYKDTAAKITALKQEYLAAQKSGSAEEMAAVQIKFNNIKNSVDDHKAFRETITNPDYGLSAAMDHSGVKEGSNGEDKTFMTGLINEDYTITTEGGKKYYNVGGVKKTMAEIKEMAILKDNVPFAAYHQTRQKYAKAKSWNREDAYFEVKNNIVPKTINGLKAFVADDGFGNGKNFTALLNDSKNKAAIKKEIDASLFDTDGVKGISGAEYDQFVLAVTDSRHETWKQADGSYDEQAWQKHTSKIVTEQLVNGMGNAWTANQPKKENEEEDKVDFYSKGNKVQLIDNQFLSGGSADALYSDIQSGASFDAKNPITKEINNYSYQIVDGTGGWYENYQEGDNPKTKESYIGGADDIADVFTNDPRFNNLETTREQEVNITGGAGANLIKLKNQNDLTKKTGIDRSLFQKKGDDVAEVIKQFLPENYDVISGKEFTFAGRKGESMFSTDDNYIQIINIKNPDEKYEFNTLYVADPVKAQEQLNDFFNKFKNKLVQPRIPGE